MKKSESIDQLATALSKAQGMFTAAERDYTAKVETRKGGSYSFNYADLAAYLDVCRGPLSENGLCVVQEPVAEGQKAKVTTLLMHASGQWIEFDPLELCVAFKEPGEIPTPQEMGSLITYARRYSQSAGLNMASEQDDDGNQASGNRAETTKKAPKPNCPKCETNTHVYDDRQKDGFFCWKQKGGCGHNWLPANESSEADAKAKADKLAAEHGMTTADKLQDTAYQTGMDTLAGYSKVSQLVTFAAWVKEERIKKTLTPVEYADLDSKIAAKATEFPSNEKGFEAAEKLLRSFHGELRISEGDYLQFCTKLADAKDQKLGAAA